MTEKSTLYTNIKKRRKELGLTQTDLANKLGYGDKSMISHIEAGRIDLPHSKIVEFAKVLDMEPGDLLGWEDNLNEENMDWLALIMKEKRLIEHIKRLQALDYESKNTIYDFTEFMAEKKSRN